MSLVQQEAFLFRGTLGENIAYGGLQADPYQILEASLAANCHEFVMAHPLAYDTPVGERGMSLSGGERQRISIARAILRDTPILVFDEATSALDAQSESSVQAALNRQASKQTKILIAHRLSTLRNCNRICVLDKGTIVESGAHAELMQRGGLYREWVNMQNEGKIQMPPEQKTNWIRRGDIRVWAVKTKELAAEVNGVRYDSISLRQCFPIHHPRSFISVIDDSSRLEIGIVVDMDEFIPAQQQLIFATLAQKDNCHYIQRVRRIKRSTGYIEFRVGTASGDRNFVLRDAQDSVMGFGLKGRMLLDLEDNLYVIRDLSQLPPREKQLFENTIFW
jgi:ABC-type sulfate/molybdate transport systems ATPase subunit